MCFPLGAKFASRDELCPLGKCSPLRSLPGMNTIYCLEQRRANRHLSPLRDKVYPGGQISHPGAKLKTGLRRVPRKKNWNAGEVYTLPRHPLKSTTCYLELMYIVLFKLTLLLFKWRLRYACTYVCMYTESSLSSAQCEHKILKS
jgi:hypothetical protein